MAYSALPTRTDADANSSADVNTLQSNIVAAALIAQAHFSRPVISNNSVDSDHDIDIAVGSTIDSTGAYIMTNAALTKQMDTAWAAGTNAGGLFDGALANTTWYGVYIIRKDSDGTIDAGCDTYANGVANLPAGYSVYRRIGYFYTDGSANIYQFIQAGNRFEWTGTPPALYSQANPGTNQVTPTVAAPPNQIAILTIRANTTTASGHYGLFGNASLTVAPGLNDKTLWINASRAQVSMQIVTNASSQIGYEWSASDANLNVAIYMVGFIDTGI